MRVCSVDRHISRGNVEKVGMKIIRVSSARADEFGGLDQENRLRVLQIASVAASFKCFGKMMEKSCAD